MFVTWINENNSLWGHSETFSISSVQKDFSPFFLFGQLKVPYLVYLLPNLFVQIPFLSMWKWHEWPYRGLSNFFQIFFPRSTNLNQLIWLPRGHISNFKPIEADLDPPITRWNVFWVGPWPIAYGRPSHFLTFGQTTAQPPLRPTKKPCYPFLYISWRPQKCKKGTVLVDGLHLGPSHRESIFGPMADHRIFWLLGKPLLSPL